MATNKTIKKTDLLNQEALDKVCPNFLMIGGHKFELRSYKEIAGHDDSLPFQAKVYVDGKECGVAYNDGWGGETEVRATKEGAFKTLNEVEKYIREHKEEYYMGEYEGIKLYHRDLSSITDMLADNCARQREALKHADKALVVYNPTSRNIAWIPFTKPANVKLSELVGSHQFKTLWYDTIAKYEDKGYTILSVKDIFNLFRKVA